MDFSPSTPEPNVHLVVLARVQYYIAPRMTLAVVGSESLDQLQAMAQSLFDKVGHRVRPCLGIRWPGAA
jgi:hypothetical protein